MPKTFVESPSGRFYVRHPSNMGSIMFYMEYGQAKKALILDARYRTLEKFGLYKKKLIHNDFLWQYYMEETTVYPPKFLKHTSNLTFMSSTCDSWVDTNIFQDPNTSEENCDQIMKFDDWISRVADGLLPITGSPAVRHCRNIIVDGKPCNLPNIQLLVRILYDSYLIDSLDADCGNVDKKYLCFQNNMMSSTFNIRTNYCVEVSAFGLMRSLPKYLSSLVVPILEL